MQSYTQTVGYIKKKKSFKQQEVGLLTKVQNTRVVNLLVAQVKQQTSFCGWFKRNCETTYQHKA